MAYAENAVATEGVPMPFTSPVIAAHEDLLKMADRISALADRLCGSQPPEPMNASQSAKLSSVPNGVFADITERGLDMGVKLDRIRRDISRIERALP